jgi:MORN repeat
MKYGRRPSLGIAAQLCATLLTATAATAAPAATSHWGADAHSGCRVWDPHPQPNQSLTWSGACSNGVAEGRGILQWLKDGVPFERDEGTWLGGRQTGYGAQTWPLGSYRGDLHDGEPSGRGLLTLGDARYEGEFRNGLPDGAGTLRNASGTYQGHWKNGCFRDDKRKVAIGVPVASCP